MRKVLEWAAKPLPGFSMGLFFGFAIVVLATYVVSNVPVLPVDIFVLIMLATYWIVDEIKTRLNVTVSVNVGDDEYHR